MSKILSSTNSSHVKHFPDLIHLSLKSYLSKVSDICVFLQPWSAPLTVSTKHALPPVASPPVRILQALAALATFPVWKDASVTLVSSSAGTNVCRSTSAGVTTRMGSIARWVRSEKSIFLFTYCGNFRKSPIYRLCVGGRRLVHEHKLLRALQVQR